MYHHVWPIHDRNYVTNIHKLCIILLFIKYECDVMSKRKNRPKTIPTNIQDLKYKFKGGSCIIRWTKF